MNAIVRTIVSASALSALALGQSTLAVPSQYPTIQAAINAATTGDTVLVGPGVHQENLKVPGIDITITSVHGAAATTIDGSLAKLPVVDFSSGSSRKCVLDGFTIMNGTAGRLSTNVYMGGGILLRGCSPTIRNCTIRNNTTTVYGGGIGGSDYRTSRPVSPLVEHCIIEDNVANGASQASGAGIAFVGLLSTAVPGAPEVRHCTIRRNTAFRSGGGAYFAQFQNGIVDSCVFTENQTTQSRGSIDGGAGINCYLDARCTLTNNRIYGNKSASDGAGIKYALVSGMTITNNTVVENEGGGITAYVYNKGTNTFADIANTIVWGNGGREIHLVGKDSVGNPPKANISHSIIAGGASGTNVLVSDPLLANATNGNHRLTSFSPAIDTGSAAATAVPNFDFEGQPRTVGQVDIGADEYDPLALVHYASQSEISLGSPLDTTYTVESHPARAGQVIFVLFSLSGTNPGTPFLNMHLPLNYDPLTLAFSLTGSFDGSGKGSVVFPSGRITLPPALVGNALFSAAAILDFSVGGIAGFTNAERVAFVQ